MYDKSQFKSYYMGIMGFFYLSQGYALGSLVLLLPLYIKDIFGETYSRSVAISAIIIIPWYFKFIFGLISDNYPIGRFGRRKPYLIIATVLSFIGWTTLSVHHSADLYFFISGFFLSTGSALSDSVVDGQIVEITPESHSARTQGIAWGSRGLGIGLAASLSPLLVDTVGWASMFNMASLFGISLSIVVLILPQTSYFKTIGNKSKLRLILSDLYDVLISNKSYLFSKRLLFIFLSGSAIAVVPLLPIIMQKEFSFTYTQISIGSLLFALGSLVGSILIGIIFDKFDTKKSFIIMSNFFALVLLSGVSFLFVDRYFIQMFYLGLVGFITGGYEAYQLKVIQDSSPENHEGTIFSIYTSISNIGQFVLGGYLIVAVSEFLGIVLFVPIMFLIVPLYLAILPLISFKFSRNIQN